MKTVFVVGNKFHEFAAYNIGVMTIGELEEAIRSQVPKQFSPEMTLVPGQGLREADVRRLRDESLRYDSLWGSGIHFEERQVRAGRRLTHKYRLRNSIISVPEQLDENMFEADLVLDERSELMTDHQTGQHIQGMVLVEAARQMFLAVTEEYFIGYEDTTRYYFVIQGMDVAFTGFVFPVEATLRYEILEKKIANGGRLYFRVAISVMQAGRCATRISYEFTAYHADRIEAKEREQAVAVLNTLRDTRAAANKSELQAESSVA